MTRWDIKNRFFDVSHDQFLTMARDFKQAVESSFDTKCAMHIDVLNQPEVYTTFWDDDMLAKHNDRNRSARITSTYNIDNVDRHTWDKAGYVEITIRPENKDDAPQSAFATAKFKGIRARQVTFYIQPDGEDAKVSMLKANSTKRHGDGFSSNGQKSWTAFAKVANETGMPSNVVAKVLGKVTGKRDWTP